MSIARRFRYDFNILFPTFNILLLDMLEELHHIDFALKAFPKECYQLFIVTAHDDMYSFLNAAPISITMRKF